MGAISSVQQFLPQQRHKAYTAWLLISADSLSAVSECCSCLSDDQKLLKEAVEAMDAWFPDIGAFSSSSW